MLLGNLVKPFAKLGEFWFILAGTSEHTEGRGNTLKWKQTIGNKYCMDGFLPVLAMKGSKRSSRLFIFNFVCPSAFPWWLRIIKIDSPKTLCASINLSSFQIYIEALLDWFEDVCTGKSFLRKSWIPLDRKWLRPHGAQYEFFMLSISGPM